MPLEQKAKRIILLFEEDEFIERKPVEDIIEEIYRVNEFTPNTIDSVFKFLNNAIIKITFSQTAATQKSRVYGLKMFNMRISHHQVKQEEFIPLKACMRCFKPRE